MEQKVRQQAAELLRERLELVKLRQQIWNEINLERNRQDKLHPSFPKSRFRQLSLALEELGEAAQSMNTADELLEQGHKTVAYDTNMNNARQELVQTAALLVRILEVWGD